LSGQLTFGDVKIEKSKRQKLKRKKRARLKYGPSRVDSRGRNGES